MVRSARLGERSRSWKPSANSVGQVVVEVNAETQRGFAEDVRGTVLREGPAFIRMAASVINRSAAPENNRLKTAPHESFSRRDHAKGDLLPRVGKDCNLNSWAFQ